MRLVGHNDLQARSAYQPTILQHGDRYLAYVGHHGSPKARPKPLNPLNGKEEFNGTSILDVTDPEAPKFLGHIPGDAGEHRRRRRPDGARLRRQEPAEGRSERDLSAAHARQAGTGDLERRRSGQPKERCWSIVEGNYRTRTRTGGNATPASPISSPACRTGASAHDRDLRPQRSGQAGEDPRLRPGRPGARRDRHGADRQCTA